MIALLDVNVLIARADTAHQFHDRAVSWLANQRPLSVATCPLTENGFLRVYGHHSYPGGPGSPAAAASELEILRARPEHRFIPDSISILDIAPSKPLQGVATSDLTDLYLLALAVRHGAVFVTFDRKIDPSKVAGGSRALLLISPAP